jgi:protein-disulfide isomerase
VSKKAWIIFAAVCIVLLGGLVYISGKDKVNVGNVDTNTIQPAVEQSGDIADHVFGKADSKVVLIEYGDFQCPGCGNAHPNLKAVSHKYEGQIAFVFRNFPLTTIHPNARAAAAAAEAAGLQGKYWELHDKLYENQSQWSSLSADARGDFFNNYASELGLKVDTFKTDFSSPKVSQKINYDIALGKKAKVSATPSIFLNGKAVEQDTWQDQEKLDKAIVDAMKEKNIAVPAEK